VTGARFDGWTRRRFELAVGSTLATALGVDRFAGTEAKKKHKHKRKKKRCRKIQAACTPGGTRKCCKNLGCNEVFSLVGTHCCRPENADCVESEDCCVPSGCFEGFCKQA